MPPVIGAAILAAVAPSLLGTAVLGISTATIVGEVALTGALIGIQALVNATSDQLKTTINVKQALAPRVRIYGRTMVSGAKAFEAVRNGNLYQVIMLASDLIDAVEAYYIGEVGVAVDANGLVQQAPWGRSGGSSYIGFEVHDGAANQAAQGLIQSTFSDTVGNFALNGIAYVTIVMLGTKAADFQKTYPQGQDTLFRFVVRGARVYDPRSTTQSATDPTTWTWSENPSLCILDFLKHSDGMAIPIANIDLPSFESFAYVCEQAVPLKAGGQEPRYRIDGTYDLSEQPRDVLARMCAACDGQLVMLPSGRIGITGGVWVEPTVTLDSDHILEADFQQGAGAFSGYNRLTASFSYGSAYYQMTELAPLNDAASQAAEGTIPQTMPLQMVTSYTQAARLAKIRMAKDNPPWKGTITADALGLDAIGEDTVTVDYAPVEGQAALVSTSCLVTSLSLGMNAGYLSTVTLGVSALTADAYSWDPATEEPDAPRTPFQISNYNNVDQPANAHASITNGVGTLTWDPPDRTDATPTAQWSPTGQNQWQPMNLGSDGQSATVYGLTKGQSYDFEVAFSAGGASSAESLVANVAA